MDKTDAHFFLEKLERHIINIAPCLTSSQKEQLQRLYRCVKSMRDYLKMIEIEIEEQDPEVKDLEMNIGDLVFDAENIVDFFFAGGGSEDVLATELARIQEEMESLRSEIDRAIPTVVDPPLFGLEEKVDLLIGELENPDQPLTIRSIVGLPGVGKTTLAQKLFDDPRTKDMFEILGWVNVSQKYQKRVLLTELLSSCSSPVSAEGSDDEHLGEELYLLLNHKKYLIVIDDIWSAEPWDQISRYFPRQFNGSAIIFTSRIVMDHWQTTTHTLYPLSQADSWKLLKATVFGNEGDSCPPELEEAGKRVAEQCAGLPISILVVGNILKKDKDKAIVQEGLPISKRWVAISKAIVPSKSTNHDTLLLSYTHLPLHLKACFLYLGLFPEDYVIPVRQLILLWIAEGFVTQQDNNKNLEVTAHDYLNDLVDRSLVFVCKRRFNGEIKTCRIHRLLRAFSFQLGMEEKFLTPRRLCIHSDIYSYIISKPSRKLSRSFLCFSKEEAHVPNKNIAFISHAFKLARVLHTEPINFPRYPGKLSKLVLLRYLAISGNISILPPTLTSFGNLQSLIVKSTSTSCTINVKADITSFSNLRHFHTNVASNLCKPAPSANPARSNLQTLSLIAPESCTEDVLGRTPYLKKLGIRGKLAQIVEEKGGSGFDVLIKLKQLERLKLLNDVRPRPPSEGQLSCLPPPSKFPQTIKKLTISKTMLHWRHISVLALLPQLEVLKLKYNAFVGHTWNATAGGFPSLKVLQIEETDLAFWDGTATDHFPVLETIVLEHCTSLQRFPSGLGDSNSTVKSIDLSYCSSVAVVSATKIKEERENINPLKLVVFPLQK